MSAYAFGAAFEVTSTPKLTSPAPIKTKNPPQPSTQAIELDEYTAIPSPGFQSSSYAAAITPTGTQTPYETHTQGVQTPKTPNELEMSRPSSRRQSVATVVPSWSFPSMNRYRILAACGVYFANGMNDACESCPPCPSFLRTLHG